MHTSSDGLLCAMGSASTPRHQAGTDWHRNNRRIVTMHHSTRSFCLVAAAALALGSVLAPSPAFSAWEPNRPIEFIVPAGTGGGADIMARTIQGIVTKHNLTKQPMVVINKAGGAGGEGFLDVKNSKDNPHKIII